MLSTQQIKQKVQTFLSENILQDEECRNCIVSIMGIGSLAKGKEQIHDIDLNMFATDISAHMLDKYKKLLDGLTKAINLPCDANIVDYNFYQNNICSSSLFPHKNRHSLFLYELSQVKCLLYGEDILRDFHIKYKDLIPECLKLVATLVHRYNKEWLIKGDSILKQAKKYARYACEFSLIFAGMKNPYKLTDQSIFIKVYPEMASQKILSKIWSAEKANLNDLVFYYDFIYNLSRIMLNRYLLLANEKCPAEKISFGKAFDGQYYFSFPSEEEYHEFNIENKRIPAYQKIST